MSVPRPYYAKTVRRSGVRSRLIAEAEELGINVSRTSEEGLAKAVREERRRRWVEDKREVMEASEASGAEHGLPLAKHRPS